MSQPESHPVINGAIATVVGGIVLWLLGLAWPPAKIFMSWCVDALLTVWRMLIASYSIPGWLLLIMIVTCVIAVLGAIARAVRSSSPEPDYLSYTKDVIHGVNWHWAWNGNHIHKLWSTCPACQGQLIYRQDPDTFFLSNQKINLFCEHCNSIRAQVTGHDPSHVIGAVEREILRRIRVQESQAKSTAS